VRAGREPDSRVTALMARAAAHVRETGRSLVSTGADDAGGKTSVLAVPLGEADSLAGVLALARSGAGVLGADDVRLAELFAETLGAMLANARDFVDANVKLVELIQVNEVAQLLNSTLDQERLAETAVEVLEKALTFEVGGFVLDGFGEHKGRVLFSIDIDRAELSGVIAEAWGVEEEERLLDGLALIGRSAGLTEEPGPSREWTVVSRELRFRNARAGEFFVASTRPGAFTADDERVLGALSAHLSTALENAVLYSRLEEDFRRAMAALGAFADATERFERGHTDRVMDFAVSLGHEMGLPLERIGLLRFAGLLHDLGKVGIAEEILIKPSVLTEQELELIRRHSEMGATIVEQVRILEEITPIVRHHHEHWDGSGYPRGLIGEDIPLEARILAVADAFEAMTGRRRHRKRLPIATARAEIERASGTQFDPAVVEALTGLLDRRALYGATGAYLNLTAERRKPELPA
jgi:HD-GYP domain-containing protein (c-di-GMP phosphodiesterase class II)